MRSRIARLLFALIGALTQVSLNLPANASDSWHVAAASVVSKEIRFSNGNVQLVGTLYMPEVGDHLPAMVALHPALAATREAGVFKHLRQGLPALGIAVLLYDRRGSGQSSGDRNRADFEMLADDAIAAQRALAKIARIDAARIGFWGLSQGGWLAVLAAGRSPDAAFAISVSAPLVTAETQMRFAMSNLLTLRGYSQSDVQEMLETRKAWNGYLHGANSREAAIAALRKAETKPWFDLAYLPKASQLAADPEHDASRRELDDDPVTAVRKARIPLLFLYGDSDPWVPVAESAERLRLLSAELHNIEYTIVPDANHEMMTPLQETMKVDEESTRNDAPQSPVYFMLMASWLARHAGK
jgi:dipeptidyl aminopeptidase/acylaminoacyl peptidase